GRAEGTGGGEGGGEGYSHSRSTSYSQASGRPAIPRPRGGRETSRRMPGPEMTSRLEHSLQRQIVEGNVMPTRLRSDMDLSAVPPPSTLCRVVSYRRPDSASDNLRTIMTLERNRVRPILDHCLRHLS